MGVTYASAGVDRDSRKEAKKAWSSLKQTYALSKYGAVLEAPFNVLYPVGNSLFHTKCCDGVGTKVLIAHAAGKHDTIGIDAVASVVNDTIRCGAAPLAVTNVIDIRSSTPEILTELQKGLNAGVKEAGCPMVSGETADVPEIMNAQYHINCDCVGEVSEANIISGVGIKEGDVVIGMRSSGVHTNGLSLVRKTLFKEWGGSYDLFDSLDGLDRELAYEALEPTKIYVKEFLDLCKIVKVLGAVHITGDAYLKFSRLQEFSNNIGFEFSNFRPQEIFNIIQEAGHVDSKEMLSTFNMGWGFAFVVRKDGVDSALDFLNRKGVESEPIGRVTSEGIVAHYKNKKIILK